MPDSSLAPPEVMPDANVAQGVSARRLQMQNARAALKAVAQQDKAKAESEGATAGFAVRSDAAAKEEEMRKAKQAKEDQAKRGREEAAAAQAAGRVGAAQKAEEAARAKEAARAGGAEQAALEQERAQKLKSANASFEAGRLMVKKVKYREAEAAFRTALQIRSDVLGKRHEEVLKVQTELGEVCMRQDNHVEAARLLHEVYESYLAAKGQADVMTLKVVHLLGNALSASARYEEAETLLKLTIDACSLQYGPSAKNTLVFKTGLGLLFDKQDRLEDAEPLLREALAARRRAALVAVVSGTHDVNDLCASMGSLAVVLQKRKQPGPLAEAEALYREALELTRKHDEGKESRTSIGLMNNLAALLKPEASRSDEVEQLLRQCIKAEKELYGPSNDATLNTTEQLASLLHHTRGLHAQAEELLRDVLQERRAALGLMTSDDI